MDVSSPHNLVFAEELYALYLQDKGSVDPAWRAYFDTLGANGSGSVTITRTNGNGGNGHVVPAAYTSTRAPVRDSDEVADVQDRVARLVGTYRTRGHRYARLDVLGMEPGHGAGPALSDFGLTEADLDTVVNTHSVPGPDQMPLRQLVALLQDTYCRTIGVEYMHIEDADQRYWLREQMEASRNHVVLRPDDQVRILEKLTAAEVFEQFLHTKFVGAKRFSLEGGESLIPMMDLLIEHAGNAGVKEILVGMAHRGRLNVLVNIVKQPAESLFAAFDDTKPEQYMGAGDVKYHLGHSTDVVLPSGRKVHVSLCFNPSHLEWVNPVVQGRTRAKQERMSGDGTGAMVPVLIHGDAAFAGQGTVMETMQLKELEGYRTGGTIHVVVNNQVGFTTSPRDARSTPYCTDIGRMFHVPIFHVNGEDPEAVAQVVTLAVQWRQKFRQDVIIDLWCYRKHGHNEGDEPSYTQPEMYQAVARKRTVREEYVAHLLRLGHITADRAESIRAAARNRLEQCLAEARKPNFEKEGVSSMHGLWQRYRGGRDADTPQVATAISDARARTLLHKLGTVPEGFPVHPKLVHFMKQRVEMSEGNKPLDWGAGEALAFASLVTEGHRVRLSGQDSRRGTFAHRHAVLRAYSGSASYTPLTQLSPEQAPFEVYDSPLSEAGVLGFDYGYSLDYPDALVIWEAQFGDFVNGAQVIIDQFMSSAEAKWHRLSGLTLFLPHGYEGQGPEHSSARIDRFLGLCAADNMQVANVTTPAQLFHLLRRQVVRPFRKPLVLFTPKSLLRHKSVVSDLSEFTSGAFNALLPDARPAPASVRRVLLCSGKVYYDLEAARQEKGITDVAILRMEQYYPFPLAQLEAELNRYPAGTPLVWVQEEPWNQGAWHFIRGRVPEELTRRHPLKVVARRASASPATGSMGAHKLEQAEIVSQALGDGGSTQ